MSNMEQFLQSLEVAIGHIEDDLGAIGMAEHLENNVGGLAGVIESSNNPILTDALGALGLTAAIFNDLQQQLPAAHAALNDIKAYIASERGY